MPRFIVMRRNRLGALVDVQHPLQPHVDGYTAHGPNAAAVLDTARNVFGIHGALVAVEVDHNDRPIAVVEKGLAS
jgi:hypothetical protein